MKLSSSLLASGICLVLALGGCATVSAPKGEPSGSQLEPLVAPHRERARALEAQGQLRGALNEWKVVLTIDPKDSISLQAKSKLEERIKQEVAAGLSRGGEALKRGVNLEARRHFLAVLALEPSNKAAFEALQTQAKDVRIVNHTVRRGETLASIADFFYGDRSRAEVIWETNQLPPNPKLVPGAVLKIPEIPGVPFVRGDAPREPRGPSGPGATPPEAAKTELPEPEEVPLLAEAREALERRQFSLALADVDKFLGQNPRHVEAIDLRNSVLYQQGKTLFEQQKYAESFTALNQLAKLAPKYQDLPSLLGNVRARLVQEHYNQGIRFYREEKLEAAVTEWRLVLQYDPNHQGAKKNIEQAERLLKGLQERQQQKK